MSVSAISPRAARGRRRPFAGVIGALVLLTPGTAISAAPRPAAPTVMAQDQPQAPAAPAAAPSEERPKNGVKPPENVEALPTSDAASLLGKKVKGANGEELGLIVDVLVDPHGQPRAAVIDFGGFLGVGSRKIAVDWKVLDFSTLGKSSTVELGLDRAQISAAPEYKPGPPGANVVTAPSAPPPPDDTHDTPQ